MNTNSAYLYNQGYQQHCEFPPDTAQLEVLLMCHELQALHGTSIPTASATQIQIFKPNSNALENDKRNRSSTNLQLSKVKSVTPSFLKKFVASSTITGWWRLYS